MIKLIADYHTHTIYSHGKGTILDNVQEARSKGLKSVAITDHSKNHFAFGIKPQNIEKMRYEIDRINEEYKDINVLLGLECNIISRDGEIDIDESIIKYLDILSLGYHMLVLPKSFLDFIHIYGRHYTSLLNKAWLERTSQRNTETMIKAINNYRIDFITHPGARIPMDIQSLSKEAAKVDTALEINAVSNVMTLEEIKFAAGQGVKFIINSDAHTPQDVGNFRDAIKLAEEAGLENEQIMNSYRFEI